MLNMKITNRRKFHRINLSERVDLEFIDDSYDCCQIKNLSLTGVFITGNFQKYDGKYCLVNFYQTEKSTNLKLSLRASAKIVRKNDKGIAIEFVSMSLESYMFLQSTLIDDAEEPLVIRQELPENYPFKITNDLPLSPETNIRFNN